MSVISKLLVAIPGDSPSGAYLRYESVYQELKDAMVEEDPSLPRGVWQRDLRTANWPFVIETCQEILAGRSKDLQIACWLCLGWARTSRLVGLRNGLELIREIASGFWPSLHPPLSDSDASRRAVPLRLLLRDLIPVLRNTPLTEVGHTFTQYGESRDVARTQQSDIREAKVRDGRLDPEAFDAAFRASPKSFYINLSGDLEGVSDQLKALQEVYSALVPVVDQRPSWGGLQSVLDEVRHVVKSLLVRKHLEEPDAPAPEEGIDPADTPEADARLGVRSPRPQVAHGLGVVFSGEEVGERQTAIIQLAQLAAEMRRARPGDAGPYLMLRGLRFGELRSAVYAGELRDLEAPPTELRRQLRLCALDGQWAELLEMTEAALALPCSRAWLDLQRLAVEACVNLGEKYAGIAVSIRSAVRSLVLDIPGLREANLLDETPVANRETQVWLDDLLTAPDGASPEQAAALPNIMPGWKQKYVAPARLASDAVRRGDRMGGVEILRREMEHQISGRARFQKLVELVDLLCSVAASPQVAQPYILDLERLIKSHNLLEWEDREFSARAMHLIYRYSETVKGSEEAREKYYESICLLHPGLAITLSEHATKR